MDVVLGVWMARETVRMVLVDGYAAGGVTIDQDAFHPAGDVGGAAAADQVVAAIRGTRESAARGGYQLASSGVTWTDPGQAAALRDALAASRIENVMLVSAFTAAAALAQAVGGATNCARTGLLFVEPSTATLAVVDTSDGSIAEVHRRPLPQADDAALAELAALVTSAQTMKVRPDGVFLVGSGVDIPLIKPALDAATPLSVTAPEEPEMALARGAALASANAHLGAPSTVAIPHLHDPATTGRQLAYSAEADGDGDAKTGPDRGSRVESREPRSRKPVLVIVGATVVFVCGVVGLAVALALGIRPHAEQRPSISKNVVAPATQAPPPKAPPNAPPPPPAVPAPAPAPPAQAPAPAAPTPAPNGGPPWQQWLPPHPSDNDHGAQDWLRRHGIPVP